MSRLSRSSDDAAAVVVAPGSLIALIGVGLTLSSAFALLVAWRRAHRTRQLESAERCVEFADLFAELAVLEAQGAGNKGGKGKYVAVRGLVHVGAQPLLATRWARTVAHSVAVRRVQTQLTDIQEISQTTSNNNQLGNGSSGDSNSNNKKHKKHDSSSGSSPSHESTFRRVQEVLHDDFDAIPFAVRDHAGADVRVLVTNGAAQLPLTRVHNDFVPVKSSGGSGGGGVNVNVNVGNSGGSGQMLGQVDRRVVGHQNEEFILSLDRPLLVVGELRRALDGDGFVVAQPRTERFEGFPFVVTQMSLDEVIAASEDEAAQSKKIAKMLAGSGVACIVLGALLRVFTSK